MVTPPAAPTPSIIPEEATTPPLLARRLAPLARNLVRIFLKRLRQGYLTIEEGQNRRTFGNPTNLQPAHATIMVNHPAFYSLMASGGSRGLGEAYIRGYWSSPDLTAALCLLSRAYLAWENVADRLAFLSVGPKKRYPWPSNHPRGSRLNIAAHYDLGNDFYALFLDETMAYSCAVFPRPDSSLSEAQLYKYDLICRKLNLQPWHHLLEIGTGWGGLALFAAQRYGCRVTTTTISQQQYEYTRQAIVRAGLTEQITLLQEDYRRLHGQFDRLVSVEMIEAVGHEYLPEFFRVCSRCLRPDGLMLLQAITLDDRRYARYRRTLDFIRSHIFPGGSLVSLQALGQAVATASDLTLVNLEDLTSCYVQTLRQWRHRFWAHLEDVRAQGFPPTFIRLWEFYLSYCEAGFLERLTSDVQLLYAKPCHRQPLWPWTPAANRPA